MLSTLCQERGRDCVKAIQEAATRFVQATVIVESSVRALGSQGLPTNDYIGAIGQLRTRVNALSAKVAVLKTFDGVSMESIAQQAGEIGGQLVACYADVVQNARITDPANESLLLGHLGSLEAIWCHPDKPNHRLLTRESVPIAPVKIKALGHYEIFMGILGEFAATFGEEPVSCFISYSPEDGQPFAVMLASHLRAAGVTIFIDVDDGPAVGRDTAAFRGKIQSCDYAIVVGSPSYGTQARSPTGNSVHDEVRVLSQKYSDNSERVVRLLTGGTVLRSFPSGMTGERDNVVGLHQAKGYFLGLFGILERLYQYHDCQGFLEEKRAVLARPSSSFSTPIKQVLQLAGVGRIDGPATAHRSRRKERRRLDIRSAVPTFVGRKKELDQLSRYFAGKGDEAKVAVLYGLGGIGKSELALQYAHESLGRYEEVFIVDCSSEETLKAGYRAIMGKYSHLVGMGEIADLRLLRMVALSAVARSDKRVLLIYDDVESPLEAEAFPEGGVDVIVTTRNGSLCRGERILVKELEFEQAVALYLRITKELRSPDVERLVRELERIPMAVDHAAHFIQAVEISAGEYLETFDLKRAPLEAGMEADQRYQHTIDTVWAKTIKRLQADHPEALSVLKLFSFFGPQIPPEVASFAAGWDRVTLMKVRKCLMDFAMIRPEGKGLLAEYRMSSLLKAYVRWEVATVEDIPRVKEALQFLRWQSDSGLSHCIIALERCMARATGQPIMIELLPGLISACILYGLSSLALELSRKFYDKSIEEEQGGAQASGRLLWVALRTEDESIELAPLAEQVLTLSIEREPGRYVLEDALSFLAAYRYFRQEGEYDKAAEALQRIRGFCQGLVIVATTSDDQIVARMMMLELLNDAPPDERLEVFRQTLDDIPEANGYARVNCCLVALALCRGESEASIIKPFVEGAADVLLNRQQPLVLPSSHLELLSEVAEWVGMSEQSGLFAAMASKAKESAEELFSLVGRGFSKINPVFLLEREKAEVGTAAYRFKNRPPILSRGGGRQEASHRSPRSQGVVHVETHLCTVMLARTLAN